jgi:FkbM family methyltransferase
MREIDSRGAEGNVDELVRARFFPTQISGLMVEVGAANPDHLSISALYRSLGWTVVAIEPNPEFCELHRQRGHAVLQYACGDHDEDHVDFTIADSHGAAYRDESISYESFSSLALKDSYADLVGSDVTMRKIKVDLRRLDTLLTQHAPEVERIDVLTIDVEGWELEVLDGFDMTRFAPRVMVIENFFAERAYRDYMRARGYGLWRYVEPNDVYVAAEELSTGDKVSRARARLSLRGRQLSGGLWSRLRR